MSSKRNSQKCICPICEKPGYLVKEKPRKKNVITRSEFDHRRNLKHKDYTSTNRPRGQYYRVFHYIFKKVNWRRGESSGWKIQRKSKFCYLGNAELAIKKLEKVVKIDDLNTKRVRTVDPKRLMQLKNMLKQTDDIQIRVACIYEAVTKARMFRVVGNEIQDRY